MSADELRARLLADPDDVDAHLVYADWLLSEGHPQGALIALHHAHRGQPVTRELLYAEGDILRRNWAQLLGTLGDPGGIELKWRLGFIRWARFFDDGDAVGVAELMRTLFALPTALLLEAVGLERSDGLRTLDVAIATLVEAPPPLLRRVALLCNGYGRQPAFGNLAPLATLPRLDSLELRGRLSVETIAAFAAGSWRLRELTVAPSWDYDEGEDEDEDHAPTQRALLGRLVAAPALSTLECLYLDRFSPAVHTHLAEAHPSLNILPARPIRPETI